MSKRSLKVWRGDASGGQFETRSVEVDEGMVVLDLVHLVKSEERR